MVHKGETPDESAAWFRALTATEADEFWTAYARKVEAGLERRRWMHVLSLLRQRGQRRHDRAMAHWAVKLSNRSP